jgi:radical SAM/Cys-rich protein
MVALKIVNQTLVRRGSPLSSPDMQRETLRAVRIARSFDDAATSGVGPLRASGIDVLQMNVGKLCNQTCRHCHVDAGPDRTEQMSDAVLERCLALVDEGRIASVDLTGGAPELHPRFEEIVSRTRALGATVMDRCNLTVLTLPRSRHLPRFFAENRVHVVASLPFHQASNTDAQRGDGVFEKSIAAMRLLNDEGYGREGSGLDLTLVTNPVGAFLPAAQEAQEALFKERLKKRHGVVFNRLFTITNMPISRYLDWLIESGNLDAYLEKLVSAFNPSAVPGVMCRTMLSVGYDGRVYDCDFNQMLEIPLEEGGLTVFDVDTTTAGTRKIATDAHCFGCTAGQGSSCGGAVA